MLSRPVLPLARTTFARLLAQRVSPAVACAPTHPPSAGDTCGSSYRHRLFSASPHASKVRVLPSAARLIQLEHIHDPSLITASGRKGHITKGDVLSFLKNPSSTKKASSRSKDKRDSKGEGRGSGAKKQPGKKSDAGPVDYDIVDVSDRSLRLATTYSTSKRQMAHAYIQADIDSSALLRAHTDTKTSIVAWVAKAAANALGDSQPVAIVRRGPSGMERLVLRNAVALTVEQIDAALNQMENNFDESPAAINVFEHEAMSVIEIIPSNDAGMALSIGGDTPFVTMGRGGVPEVSTKRVLSLSFDASAVDSMAAAAALERIAKSTQHPDAMLL